MLSWSCLYLLALYLLALYPILRPCLGHSLYITYPVSLQYLVHPCPSHTCPRSPRRTACTTSGKHNRLFHPHASVLTTNLESSHSSKPKSKLNILKNDLTTHIIPDLKSINAEKQQQQNRKQLSLKRGNLESQQIHNP